MITVSVIALLTIADYFFPAKGGTLETSVTVSASWASMITVFSLYLGVVNLFVPHIRRIRRRDRGMWPFSVWMVTIFVVTAVLGLLPPIMKNETFAWIYNHMTLPISNTMSTFLAFYIIGVAARVLRFRNLESTVMMITVVLVMFSTVPIFAVIHPILPQMGSWMLDVPNMAGNRGLVIVLGIGAVALGIRQIAGRERMILGIGE